MATSVVIRGVGGSNVPQLNTVPIQTSNYTANSNEIIPVDVSSNTVTIFLPSSPSHGDKVKIIHVNGSLSVNNLYIDGNGNLINNLNDQVQIDVTYGSVLLIYVNSVGWIIL
ncbi:MAG: hypothetical protein ABIK31_07225 [candidate division WOR-3 bacterium]